MLNSSRRDPSPLNFIVILLAMGYPTLLTWVYFALLKDSPGAWQQAAFGLGKVLQFGGPAVWVFWVWRRPFSLSRPDVRWLGIALLIGMAQLAAGWLVYSQWLRQSGLFEQPQQEMLAKLRGFGLDSRVGLIVLGVVYSAVHSLMEEYYWRWFVMNELEQELRQRGTARAAGTALVISSLAFMAHHVIVLAGYFRWDSPWTYLLSACVAIGGLIFGWLYQQSKSIYAPWLAHAFADAAIFLIGYDLLAGQLT
jgi:membrane protease YdiL (CAAX protease family)